MERRLHVISHSNKKCIRNLLRIPCRSERTGTLQSALSATHHDTITLQFPLPVGDPASPFVPLVNPRELLGDWRLEHRHERNRPHLEGKRERENERGATQTTRQRQMR